MKFEIETIHNMTYRLTEEEVNAFEIVGGVFAEMENHLMCLEDCYTVCFNNNEIFLNNGDEADTMDMKNASDLIHGILLYSKK